ncbi:hypothetical protein B0J12DRAFT_77124 [Macrophomina phaseolina]|uniref:Uncharacterized protein n=1 Tax=Macrophomina phaseolina TaxID=35725 RepID=A0ABQ8GEA2_9PEZI|nr:hypothetical protein B0J12DRAFT_77124 [Macrophomina phaseolina]
MVEEEEEDAGHQASKDSDSTGAIWVKTKAAWSAAAIGERAVTRRMSSVWKQRCDAMRCDAMRCGHGRRGRESVLGLSGGRAERHDGLAPILPARRCSNSCAFSADSIDFVLVDDDRRAPALPLSFLGLRHPTRGPQTPSVPLARPLHLAVARGCKNLPTPAAIWTCEIHFAVSATRLWGPAARLHLDLPRATRDLRLMVGRHRVWTAQIARPGES